MAGISSKALAFGEPKNKEKTFQGQRFDDELDLNWVQFKWRNHDPQIGRFIEIDPLSEDYEYNSTYAFSENKVTTHVELEGLEAEWFERQVERDLRDVSSGKISTEQLEQRVNARNAIGSAIFTKVIVPIAAAAAGGEIAAAHKLIKSLARSGNEEAPSTGGDKRVPNPNGRKGGEAHQETINEVEKGMQERGLEAKREVRVDTKGGNKDTRYVDIEGKDPKTGITEQVQVGKQNKDGTPVSRERKAMDDIEKATGTRPKFEPYNPTVPKIKI